MPKAEPTYPFVPKSTAPLRPGQFWSIPLENGRFACGRVLQLKLVEGRLDSRLFLAGLMDWDGPSPPTAETIARASIADQGQVHIKTIVENAGVVLGLRPLEADGIEPGLFLSHSEGPGILLQKGFEIIGPANPELKFVTPVLSTWGYSVIKLIAEQRFGRSASTN